MELLARIASGDRQADAMWNSLPATSAPQEAVLPADTEVQGRGTGPCGPGRIGGLVLSESCLTLQTQKACSRRLEMSQQPIEVLLSCPGSCYWGHEAACWTRLVETACRTRAGPQAHHAGVANPQTWCQVAATPQGWSHTELSQRRCCPSKAGRQRACRDNVLHLPCMTSSQGGCPPQIWSQGSPLY